MKLGTDPSFADQAGSLFAVVGVGDLDRYCPMEQAIEPPKDAGRSSSTNQLEQFVAAGKYITAFVSRRGRWTR